jgi:glycosyltransferase involved in cell wall biosynthesis
MLSRRHLRKPNKKGAQPVPKVSVVIPTYNCAHFLGEAIQSVLDQTFQDFEIIVIDDGSTDNTPEVASAFPVRYLHQENQGVSATNNRGIELSRGEYILSLDSDDVLLKDALEKGVEVLDRHPEVGFSYGQAYMMDENGHIFRVRKSSFLEGSAIVDSKEQVRELLFFNRITTSTVMMRRHCLDEVGGFHEELTNFEDHHLFIRLAKRYPVAYIAEPLVKYRVHPSQLHKSVNPKVAERAFLLMLQEVFEDPDLAPHLQPWKSQAYSHSYRRIARYAYGSDMRLARHYFRKALRVYPQIMLQRDGLFIAYKYATSLLPKRLRLALRDLKWRFLGSKRLRE